MPYRFDRDAAFSSELGTDRNDAIQEMIVLKKSLYVFTTKKIYRIHTADDIDPERTAPDTRHSHQEIYPIGCSNSFVARSIIQAKQILDRVILVPGLSKSNVLNAIWEATELLLRCENAYSQIYIETISLLTTCDELIEEFKSKQLIHCLPQVSELEERVSTFLGSAKRCLEKTHALFSTFYDCPDHGSNFQEYRKWMAGNRSRSEAVLTMLDGDKDWIRFIANARNALSINHAKQNFILEVQNFKLQPGNKFSGPSWRHDLSARNGPIQEYWSDIIKDMDIHMDNMLSFLEEVYILCILDCCDRRIPFEFSVYRKSEDDISEEFPVLYFAQVTRRAS
ncbi:MAG: hypothetical protein C4527_06415 [Candidatus Omnitrophota bacterium]|jgi:hypothetical protein|nr:MAG: hypothetical protein C4527_06415 [Candidatus Omnitrophota bacterium]